MNRLGERQTSLVLTSGKSATIITGRDYRYATRLPEICNIEDIRLIYECLRQKPLADRPSALSSTPVLTDHSAS